MPDLIRDRYEPLEVAGRGGQGQVWRALDHQHRRHVALKVRALGPDTDREAVLSEARTLLGLRPHPGLPLVREDFFEDDRYYLVMDWIEGTDLASAGPLDPEEALGYLAQVAGALDHLHAHEPPVVHRDVKPANLILTADGRAVLVDLGISAPGTPAAGTAGYAAPEVAAGEPPTPAADVFSLAATAVALLTGRPPAPGERPSWEGLAAERASRLDLSLRRALSVDPTRRPASATALIEAIRAEASIPTNLPGRLTSFVGREQQLSEVAKLLESVRLVTLTGAGGVGKTSLGIEVARRCLEGFPDGAWLVELAPLADPGLVPQGIASALGLREQPGRAVSEVLGEHLVSRHLLLVLDNCEHLVEACASLAASLLASCPHLVVLATSREALRTGGEAEYRVPSLEVPGEGAGPEPVEAYEAARLFLDRATSRRPHLALNQAAARAVGEICRRLDGIPLAIELAAARAGVLSPEEIAARLERRFDLLVGGDRAALERHRTLRGALDWSYDLLSEPERALFRRLSVFAGGFTLDAAQKVGSGEGVPEAAVLDLLQALVDKSLVIAEEDGEAALRYRMLETMRQYGSERLGPDAPRVRRLHLERFLALAEEAEAALQGADQEDWLGRLEAEHENIRAALRCSEGDGDAATGLRLAVSLRSFWDLRGHWEEALRWGESLARANPGAPDELRARALSLIGNMTAVRGDPAGGKESLLAGLALGRKLGHARLVAEILTHLGWAESFLNDQERSGAAWEEAASQARAAGSTWLLSGALSGLGMAEVHRDDFAAAVPLLEEALARGSEAGNRAVIAAAKRGLGLVWDTRGDYGKARSLLEESLSIYEEMGNPYSGVLLEELGRLAMNELKPAEAVDLFGRALRAFRRIGFTRGIVSVLVSRATVALSEGDLAEAQARVGEALSVAERTGNVYGRADALHVLGGLEMARGNLDVARRAWKEALRILHGIGQRYDGVRCLEALACLASAERVLDRAARLLGFAGALREALDGPVPPSERPAIDDATGVARRGLGGEVFEAVLGEGRKMSLDEAVAFALEDAAQTRGRDAPAG